MQRPFFVFLALALAVPFAHAGSDKNAARWFRYYDDHHHPNVTDVVTPEHVSHGYDELTANMQLIRHVPPQRALMGPRFEQFAMVSQAAVAGLGLAIVPRFLVEEELRSGALVIPVDRSLVGQEGYYLVYPEEKANLPAVTAFRDWLLAEVGPSA